LSSICLSKGTKFNTVLVYHSETVKGCEPLQLFSKLQFFPIFFSFEKLTLSGEVDEPDDHEDGVEVELLSRVLLPAIDNIGYL
jgi:hypothetical protein